MESDQPPTTHYQLGPFTIKGQENLIEADGEVTNVLPKVMRLLLYFCENPQKVVTFDDIISTIWPREVVGDNAVYNLVGQLRKVLGDSASAPKYIQTISKVGYRLLVDAHAIPVKDDTSATKPSLRRISTRPVILATACCVVIMLVLSFLLLRNQSDISIASAKQLQLGYYQLNRGDAAGVDQAISTFQELLAVEPNLAIAKVELAYAFIRKSRIEPENTQFWLTKASTISASKGLGPSKDRLVALLSARMTTDADLISLQPQFSASSVVSSERLAYADLLFDAGLADAALEQVEIVLVSCVDCPYVYRKLASIQMVLGEVQQAFDSFSHYRMLLNKSTNNPLDNAGYVPLNRTNLTEMANWLSEQPLPGALLPHQRNALALFYLNLGRIDKAESLMQKVSTDTQSFFDLYTLAAIAGAKGDFNKSYVLLNKRQQLFPDNERFKLSVVFALWQLGKYEQAMQAFTEFELVAPNSEVPSNSRFETKSLYAALLKATGNTKKAEENLDTLIKSLKSGMTPGSGTADIRLALALSLHGQQHEALSALETALSQGWVSDFNQSWWYLQDSPYFNDLKSNPRFKRLVARHQKDIEGIGAL